MADDPTPEAPLGTPRNPNPAPDDATPPASEETPGGPDDLGDAGKKAIKAERDRAAAAERKAKELETQLEDFKRSQMSEQEKAIEEARSAGKAEALSEAGVRVAKAEFKAAVSGRLEGDSLDAFIAGLNLASFLDADGQVDTTKVKTYVDSVIPAGRTGPIDFGQGVRGSETQIEMDPKKLAERVRPNW